MTRITQWIAAVLLCGGMSVVVAATMTRAEPPPAGKHDALLAPIALYPDALVLQILHCASAPDQITKLNEWIKNNPDVKGTAAQDALTAEGYEPSFVAIVLFPQVVQMMAEKPDWTRDVAQAFAEDRNGVFASIQQLRKQAQSMGNLATSEQQQVETVKTQSGQEVIVIQPANPQVVYVPQYNPAVVYTQPPPPPDPGRSVAAGLIGFTAGVIVGNAMDDDDDYYGCGGWGYRGPAMCEEGFEDFAEHRQDMAKDYYEHRENVAAQRGETQAKRQEKSGENQAARQESSAANQAARKEGSSANQAARQDSASANQGARQESRDSAQPAAAQSTAAPRAEGTKAQRPPQDASARASAKSAGTSTDRAGTKSSACTGYQSGTKEREASSRGKSSAAKQSSGGSRGGGGGSRGGGGGGGGGRGR